MRGGRASEASRGLGRARTGGIFMFVINISRVIIISRYYRKTAARVSVIV